MAEEQVSATNENEPVLSPEEQQAEVKKELALVPEKDRNEIIKVSTTADLIILATHKKKVTSFKRKYPESKFKITDDMVFDKEKLDKALEAWREVKNYRTKKIEPELKALKNPHNTIIKFYNEKGNPLIEDSKIIEKPISDFIDKMEALKKEEDEKEERELQKRTTQRVKDLLDAGACFDGEYYSLGSEEFEVSTISIGMSDINAMSDDIFNNMFEQLKAKAKIIATKQKAKEEAAAAQEEENKREQERQKAKLEEEKNKLKEKNARLRSKELKLLDFIFNEESKSYFSDPVTITQDQVETYEDEQWEKIIADAENKIESKKENDKKEKRITERNAELITIGLTKSLTGFVCSYKEDLFSISYETIASETTEWEKIIADAKERIAKQQKDKYDDEQKELHEKELATTREGELAEYWQFVTPQEKTTLGKISTDNYTILLERVKKSHADKVEKDLKEKQEKDNKEKEENLAKQGDEAMYNDLVARLKATSIPEVTTDEYKGKVTVITNFLNGLK